MNYLTFQQRELHTEWIRSTYEPIPFAGVFRCHWTRVYFTPSDWPSGARASGVIPVGRGDVGRWTFTVTGPLPQPHEKGSSEDRLPQLSGTTQQQHLATDPHRHRHTHTKVRRAAHSLSYVIYDVYIYIYLYDIHNMSYMFMFYSSSLDSGPSWTAASG